MPLLMKKTVQRKGWDCWIRSKLYWYRTKSSQVLPRCARKFKCRAGILKWTIWKNIFWNKWCRIKKIKDKADNCLFGIIEINNNFKNILENNSQFTKEDIESKFSSLYKDTTALEKNLSNFPMNLPPLVKTMA